MQLDSALFLWFFLAVFLLSWSASRWPLLRLAVLVVASWAFYATFNVALLGLIAFSTLLDFGIGIALGGTGDPRSRKALVLLSVVSNLGLLAIFKYADFFATSGNALAVALGLSEPWPVLDLVLPVGISFYTFQTMSYTIDIYREKIRPTRNILEFALYVCFFPQLIAGPIVRATEFLPQLSAPPRADHASSSLGLWLIAAGLAKKVLIADRIAVDLIDGVFERPELYSGLEALVAAYGYSIQIYCDFSGYSDVAIGAALLLGFQLPENFDRPFQSGDLAEFWRRWHKTLSFWLRDYLYIPLGGNRGGPLKTYRNLFLTMLLGGLWHGANWTFVLWGVLHGVGLGIVRFIQRSRGGTPLFPHWVAVLLTFHFVVFCFVLFRADDIGLAGRVLTQIVTGGLGTTNLPLTVVALVFGALAFHWTPRRWTTATGERFERAPALVQGILVALLCVALYQLQSLEVRPYIYYQF